MGIKERQERERQATRDAILQAARELFVSEGYRNVSLRKIAERIEYSPAAIYSYFPSKDDLFFALAEEGFRKLFEFIGDQIGLAAERARLYEEVRAKEAMRGELLQKLITAQEEERRRSGTGGQSETAEEETRIHEW